MQTPNGLAPDQQPQKWGNMQQQYSGLMQPIRTLWVGDLQYWMDENYLYGCFAHTGEELINLRPMLPQQHHSLSPLKMTLTIPLSCAEEALRNLHGTVIGQQSIRLSWGRSPANKQRPALYGWGQFNSDPNQWGGYYGYGQSYEGYEYPQDPAAYAYAYGNYLGYENYTPQGDDQSAGVQSNANSTQVTEHKEEEALDPLAPPDIDKLNAAYIAVHQASLLGRHLWLKTSQQVPAA